MKTKKCAFTGHRPQSLPFGFNEADERCIALKQKLRDEIIRQIEENGVTHFITGMAIGVDMFAAEIVLGLKSAYNGITLECAFPCETQAEKWSEALRDRYFDIASKCDKETLLQQRLFFASTFSSKMQIKFLKVAWGISPLLHFLHRHCFRCRGGAVAGIQSLLVTGM